MISRRSEHSVSARNVLMSPKRETSGQCLARTRWHHSSRSTCHRTVQPARSRPRSIPPIPEKRLPTVGMSTQHLEDLTVEVVRAPDEDLDAGSRQVREPVVLLGGGLVAAGLELGGDDALTAA